MTIKNIYKHISLEDSTPNFTESEELAVKTVEDIKAEDAAVVKDQVEENEQVIQAKAEETESIQEQANDPFNADLIKTDGVQDEQAEADDGEGSEESGSDSESDNGDEGVSDTPAETEVVDSDGEAEEIDEATGEDTVEAVEDDLESGDAELPESDELDAEDVVDPVEDESEATDEIEEDSEVTEDEVEDSETDVEDASEEVESDGESDIEEESDDGESESEDSETDSETDTEDSEGADTEDEEDVEESEDASEDEVEVEDIDLSTTEDDVEDAEDKAEEADKEADEIEEELVDDSKTLEDIEKESASVEEFIGLLKIAKKHNKFEPMFMATVSTKLNKLSEAFGSHAPSIPSLESYNDESNVGEYYTHSMESFNAFKKKLSGLKKAVNVAIVEKTRQWTARKIEPKADAINAKLDNVIAKLVDKPSDFKMEVKFISMDLGKQEPLKIFAEDLKNLTKVNKDLLGEQLAHQTKAVEAIKKVGSSGGPGKTGKIVSGITKLKPKFKPFSGEYNFVQNFKFLEPKQYKGEDSRTAIGNSVLKFAYKLDNGNVTKANAKTSYTLTKAEAMRVLTLAKAYVGLARKAKADADAKIYDVAKYVAGPAIDDLDKDFNVFMTSVDNNYNDLTQEQLDELHSTHALLNGTRELNKASLEVMRFVLSHAIFTAGAIARHVGNRL